MRRSVPGPTASPLLSLVVVTFVLYFSWGLISPVLPLFGRELSASESAIGLLVGAFSLASFSLDIIGGRISDRIGARRAAVIGACLVAGGSLLGGLAPNYGVLLVARVFTGAGFAFYVTTAMNILARTTEPVRMGRTMGAYQGAILSAVALGPAAGGLLTEFAGFRLPFLVGAGSGLLCAGIALRTLPARLPRPPVVTAGSQRLGPVLRNRAFQIALAVAFVVFIIRAGVTATTVPLFANEELGLSQGVIGVVLAVSAVSNLICLPHAGRTADRHPRRIATAIGLTAALAGLGLLAAGTGVPGLFTAMLLIGVATAYAGVTPAAIITDVTPPTQSGTTLGFYRMAVDGASVLAPLSAGILAGTVGFRGVFLAFCLPLALVLLADLRLRDTRRTTSPSTAPTPAEASS